ncbi:MAG: hypothetical protein WAL30_05600 [Candidatus Aquirickettsiella sp.]
MHSQHTISDNQAYIVNLSTIHGLAPISDVLNKFAKLHYDYAKSSLHFKWYSKLWASLKYLTLKGAINEYKLGEINTEVFISQLHAIFNFLPTEQSTELLQQAWNSLINWDAKSTARLKTLLNKNLPIYFIANTNPLHIQKIIDFFNQNSGINWQVPGQTQVEPLKIADNFYLFPSYLFKEFKEGTPGLISHVMENLPKEIKQENRLLVSQYKPDLDKATALGIKRQAAEEFFLGIIPTAIASQAVIPLNNTIPINQSQIPLSLPNTLIPTSRQAGSIRFYTSENSSNLEDIQNITETSPLFVKQSP